MEKRTEVPQKTESSPLLGMDPKGVKEYLEETSVLPRSRTQTFPDRHHSLFQSMLVYTHHLRWMLARTLRDFPFPRALT